MNRHACWRPTPIAAHRLISDGQSSALIGPAGEVDWWCHPRFHSPPLCWTLLDQHGGTAHWIDAVHVGSDGTPAGPTSHTTIRIGFGPIVEVWDGLIAADGETELVRLVRCDTADLDVTHAVRLGGFDEAWGVWDANEIRFSSRPPLYLHGGHSVPDADGVVRTRLRAARGEWAALAISPRTWSARTSDLVNRLLAEEATHSGILRRCNVPNSHAERALHTLAVLEACTDRSSGAVVASPTTSLPEVVGGDRQFDYRYSWLRDSSVAIMAASLVGQSDLAGRYVRFLVALGGDGILESPVRRVDGKSVDPERTVDGVDGWFDSRPVRVGNSAGDQLQYDALGFVLDAILSYCRSGHRFDRDLWSITRILANRAADASPAEPSNGIWEIREPAPLVSADIGRWIALDRALRLTRRRIRAVSVRRVWKRARNDARDRVLEAIRPDGSLPHTYGKQGVDASALLIVIFGLLPRRDRRNQLLVDATIRALGAGPLLYRYPPDGRDGFSAGEAPFVPASWWAVTALALLDDPGAQARADELCAMLPVLQPEQFDPARREALGNTPLLWSHAECTRALFELDRQRAPMRRLRRGGVVLREVLERVLDNLVVRRRPSSTNTAANFAT